MGELGEITQLLGLLDERRGAERREVMEQLVPLVYRELKTLARINRARWHGPESPGTTSLVHDAYMRLARKRDAQYNDRRHFFGVAAKAMRSILVDNARWHGRQKRGGDQTPVTLEEATLVSAARSEELLEIDRALDRLAEDKPDLASIVECRCFGGLTVEETAEALEVSPATVKRRWSLARAWLYRELNCPAGA